MSIPVFHVQCIGKDLYVIEYYHEKLRFPCLRGLKAHVSIVIYDSGVLILHLYLMIPPRLSYDPQYLTDEHTKI